jgi:hypothetical protein
MFRLIRFLISFVSILFVAYFVFFVDLGDKTLYQHISGIAKTPQAKKLGGELEKKAADLTNTVIKKVPGLTGSAEYKEKSDVASLKKQRAQNAETVKKSNIDSVVSKVSKQDKKELTELIKSTTQ